ncbi:hypothetical protein HZS_7327 [Henneguya salminicola]|nr:hypothetical protein HZS_7327 [Henneguya salminicola]
MKRFLMIELNERINSLRTFSVFEKEFNWGSLFRSLLNKSTLNEYTFMRLIKNLLSVKVHVFLYKKLYYDASVIVYISDYLLTNPLSPCYNFIYKFHYDLSQIKDLMQYHRICLMHENKKYFPFCKIKILVKYLEAYLIISGCNFNDLFNFFLDSKKCYISKLINNDICFIYFLQNLADTSKNILKDSIDILVNTVKNSSWFENNFTDNILFDQLYMFDHKKCIDFYSTS